MASRYGNRLWLAAGFLVVVLLVAGTYFGVVSTMSTDTDALHDQTGTAQLQMVGLRKQIAKLEADRKNEKQLTAARDAYRDALPTDSGVPAFLRQLQASGSDVGVDVSGLTVGTPSKDEAVPGVWSIEIQLTADGEPGELDDFLGQLQGSAQKRAVLIESAALANSESENSKDLRLNLTVKAFVAPPVGAGAPTVTTN
ncbi:type 4a pilus biogenesis protein PilO [Nucisporomicrobium flavum]|uniref:type 4a pilus biogenesis protein PilO n=1 Tax=Nucisporomicrobium flavum TaxID=2785915 RepID=UPI0018F4D823|nr:type 4a pilus biogenesis protein PilO [Nucisporomicrobium flavum]